ncbi:MAG TPA: heavy metal translocating P-type ATPase, partial [Gammaproteobacteria bacterium]|nr:heavy metal translocating P-type ATPase [Gammaproteobacteria bacterium]
MGTRWHADLYVFAASLTGLAAGGVLALGGRPHEAAWAWMLGSLPAAAALLWRMGVMLLRREVGLDLLALAAIAGALLLGEDLT